MAAEAILLRGISSITRTAALAVASGEVQQLADGRAAVNVAANAVALGSPVSLTTDGQFTVQKASGVVLLDGAEVYWDASASSATYKKVSDRDFYLGRAVGDWAGTDGTVQVDLNVRGRYEIDLARDGFQSVLVGTPAAGGFGYPVNLGSALVLELSATNEAQKVDALSVDGFAVGANAIIDLCFRVLNDGAGSTPDFSIGLASATHASDADAIAEHLFIHLDGNNVNVNAQSKDGTTTVASTDTTVDYTEGSALASRVYVTIDTRDLTSVKVYVNGARVLSGTTFRLDNGAGPWFLLAHLEKTASTDTYKVAVDWARARFSEQ